MKSKILISTGGSGGHVIPAITMHDHLKENYDILISSDVRGLKYLDDKFYNTLVIDTPKLNNFILLPLSILKVFFLTLRSLILLKKKEIQILISTGGYMSLPLCLASNLLNIKIYRYTYFLCLFLSILCLPNMDLDHISMYILMNL